MFAPKEYSESVVLFLLLALCVGVPLAAGILVIAGSMLRKPKVIIHEEGALVTSRKED